MSAVAATVWGGGSVSVRGQAKRGGGHRRLMVVLALPAFGIALAYTVVTTYVPVLVTQLSGPLVTGGMIAMEGLLGVAVPPLVGAWSDRLGTRLGGRLPFVAGGAALSILGLVLLPITVGLLVGIAVALLVFFVGYFAYYTPYYALFPDLVDDDQHGRSQGFLGAGRSAGLLLGMAGGGVLLGVWMPLPFLIGAVTVAVVTGVVVIRIRGRVSGQNSERAGEPTRIRDGFLTDWRLVREHRQVRRWAIGNGCWEAAIGVLRTFVVVFFTKGLGLSLAESSAALVLVGGAALVAAPVAGKLADRYGPRPVMRIAVWVFALGLIPPLITTNKYFIAAIVPIAFAAVVLMTLPYVLLMDLMPGDDDHGAGASLVEASRGIGILVGPLLAGIAVQLTSGVHVLTLAQTHGYAAIFAIAMLMLLLSTLALRRIRVPNT